MFVLYREHARKLALENEALQNQVMQTEKDTIDVISFLKSENEEKEKQVSITLYYITLQNYTICVDVLAKTSVFNFVCTRGPGSLRSLALLAVVLSAIYLQGKRMSSSIPVVVLRG